MRILQVNNYQRQNKKEKTSFGAFLAQDQIIRTLERQVEQKKLPSFLPFAIEGHEGLRLCLTQRDLRIKSALLSDYTRKKN